MNTIKKIILAFIASGICSYTWTFAAWVDHFEVNFTPNTISVWEAMDLTIEAVDKNNEAVVDYDWTILIFSESDPEAELPSALQENTYTFSAADQWKIKFENSVKFKTAWTQNIYIYDLNDDTVFWIWEAEVTKQEVVKNIDISIISPEDWLTIWDKIITISWETQKNYQVKIIVNWKDEFATTSNNDWIFEKEITSLIDWDNIFKAQVLDADLNVIWETKEVTLRVDADNLSIKNVQITPESVDPE